MRTFFVYLSGSIKKSTSVNDKIHWTGDDIAYMVSTASKFDLKLVFLNPATRSDDLSDELSLFGRDMLQVYLSDCLLVDGRDKKGVGIGYEMAFANFKNIPIITWVPYDSHYRPKELHMLGQRLVNWSHPFIKIPSNLLTENLYDAISHIAKTQFAAPRPLIKDDFVFPAIQHYIQHQFQQDKEMKILIESNEKLREKICLI